MDKYNTIQNAIFFNQFYVKSNYSGPGSKIVCSLTKEEEEQSLKLALRQPWV